MTTRRFVTNSVSAAASVASWAYLTGSHTRGESRFNYLRSTRDVDDHVVFASDDDDRLLAMAEKILRETKEELDYTIKQYNKKSSLLADTKVKAVVAARFVDLLSRSAVALLDYKLHDLLNRSDDELHQVHRRAAKSLHDACASHGGLLVKLGQYISNNGNSFIPEEYVEALKPLQDACAPLPIEVVRECIEEELKKLYKDSLRSESGALVDQVFQEIEPVPLGSASLAQVHAATLKDGRRVALKVQRKNLDISTKADLVALQVLSRAIERAFPGTGFEFVIPEFHKTITAELDFTQEAYNSERCDKMLKGFTLSTGASLFNLSWRQTTPPRTIIPAPIKELTTDKLLTMTFEDGFKINDTARLRENGIDPRKVAAAACSLFSELMLVHGFVYVDCHPGNVLVRPRMSLRGPTGEFDIVLLDHGMYRRLDERFRSSYCKLWAGLVCGNDKQALKGIREMGLDDKYLDLMGLILTYRIPPCMLGPDTPLLLVNQRLGTRMGQDAKKAMREYFRKKFGEDIMSPVAISTFIEEQSRDLLYCIRCTNLVRGLNRQLGGTSMDRFLAFGSAASRGVNLTCVLPQISLLEAEEIVDSNDMLAAVKSELNRPVLSEVLAMRLSGASTRGEVVALHPSSYSDHVDTYQMILLAWWKGMLLDLAILLSGTKADMSGPQVG